MVTRGGDRACCCGRDGVRSVLPVHVVVAQAPQQLPHRRNLYQVLGVNAEVFGGELVAVPEHPCVFIDPVAVVGRASGGGGLGEVHPTLRGGACGINPFFLLRKIYTCQQLVLETQRLELLAEVALCIERVHVLHLQVTATREHGAGAKIAQVYSRTVGACRGAHTGKPDGAGAQVTGELAFAHLGLQFGVGVKAVGVFQRQPLRRASAAVTHHAEVCRRGQAADDGVGRPAVRGLGLDPGQAIVDAVVVVQAIQAGQKFVSLANAHPVSGGDAFFVDAAACAIVVGLVGHGVDAQGCAFTRLDIEVTRGAHKAMATQCGRDIVLGDQFRHFADLVNRTARGAPAKEHGGRAAQQLNPVVVEHVAVVKSRVTHAVDE